MIQILNGNVWMDTEIKYISISKLYYIIIITINKTSVIVWTQTRLFSLNKILLH